MWTVDCRQNKPDRLNDQLAAPLDARRRFRLCFGRQQYPDGLALVTISAFHQLCAANKHPERRQRLVCERYSFEATVDGYERLCADSQKRKNRMTSGTNADLNLAVSGFAERATQASGAVLGAIAIVAFQSGFLPFFQPLFADDRLSWPFVYYGYWILTVIVAALTILINPTVRRESIPVILVCGLTAALTSHRLDPIAKNLIVAMMLMVCVTVLMLGSMPLLLLRFSASVTALVAVICLLDILFADGFTNTSGRAAGLEINPNDAAANLLIGTAAAYRAVPRRLLVPFLILVLAAIFVTLSRPMLLAAIFIGCGTALLSRLQIIRTGERRHSAFRRPGCILATALGSSLLIVVALYTNDRFMIAATDSLQRVGECDKCVRAGKQSNPLGRLPFNAPRLPTTSTKFGTKVCRG